MIEPDIPTEMFKPCAGCDELVQASGYALQLDRFIIAGGNYWHAECYHENPNRSTNIMD